MDSIRCSIISRNNLLIDKLNRYIENTYFLCSLDDDEDLSNYKEPLILFVDVDSFNLKNLYIRKFLLSLPLAPIFISSTYHKGFIGNWLELPLPKFGFLTKKFTYKAFTHEISVVIDDNVSSPPQTRCD